MRKSLSSPDESEGGLNGSGAVLEMDRGGQK